MKKIFLISIIMFFALATLATASLVAYWSQTEVIFSVTESVSVVGGDCTLSSVSGGNYTICTTYITNNLNREIGSKLVLEVFEWNENSSSYIPLTNENNLLMGFTFDYNNWTLISDYPGEYDSSVILNNTNILVVPLVNGILEEVKNLPAASTISMDLYLDSDVSLINKQYKGVFTLEPSNELN